tara:strand:+ start:69 stop:377 length:309 start_codon:yes stop_codon:yes gene_type:complete
VVLVLLVQFKDHLEHQQMVLIQYFLQLLQQEEEPVHHQLMLQQILLEILEDLVEVHQQHKEQVILLRQVLLKVILEDHLVVPHLLFQVEVVLVEQELQPHLK